MKKLTVFFFILILTLTVVACNGVKDGAGTQSGSSTSDVAEITKESVVYDAEELLKTDGVFECERSSDSSINYLKLPYAEEKVKIVVSDDCVDHWDMIDEELFIAAGKKIFSNIDGSAPFLEIYIDNENIYIYGECIVDIDPPNTENHSGDESLGGCGVDHDHIIVRERISKAPVED